MATIRDVIALVLGNDHEEPPWLAGRLEQMARRIRAYVEGETSAPKRTDMRRRLDAFREAVVRIQEDLSDPGFVNYIGNDWSSLPLHHHDVLDALATLGNRASSISMKFAGRAGSERAFPTERSNTISSQELCMWTIMQAMRRCRGLTTIAADNLDAWNAANAFYGHCGGMTLGKPQSGGRSEPSGWREYIIEVQHIEREDSNRAAGLRSWAATFEAISLAPFTNAE